MNDRIVLSRMNLRSLSRKFGVNARRAGVGGNLHSLRHTFCTTLVARGVSLVEVKALAGHSTVTVTEKYAHAAESALRERVALLDL